MIYPSRHFWSSIKPGDPRRIGNPNFDKPNLYSKGLPIALYGDGVSLGWHFSRSSFKNAAIEGVLGDREGLSKANCHFVSGYFHECEVLPSHGFSGGTTMLSASVSS